MAESTTKRRYPILRVSYRPRGCQDLVATKESRMKRWMKNGTKNNGGKLREGNTIGNERRGKGDGRKKRVGEKTNEGEKRV